MKKNIDLLITISILLSFQSNWLTAQTDPADQNHPVETKLHAGSKTAVDIGTRLELFVDDFIIEYLDGGAELRMHHPEPKEIVIVHDQPWEGSGSYYHTVFKDGDIYRMYYIAWQESRTPMEKDVPTHPGFACCAESDDGIHWRKPELGLYEFRGSKANNIVMWDGPGMKKTAIHFVPFRDNNPESNPQARYKGIGLTKVYQYDSITRSQKFLARKLLIFQSQDGIHWQRTREEPILEQDSVSARAFDSPNVPFWDETRKEYRIYFRDWKSVRSIKTATSADFLNWSSAQWLDFGTDAPRIHLYTNGVQPYYRAPHLFIGFPTRYTERAWSESMRALPQLEHRHARSIPNTRFGTALTEGLLMISRDGVTFKRWEEAFLRPGIEREETWAYGNHYIGCGLLETGSALEGAPNELSLYASEGYWTGTSSALRRYTIRVDGFVSVNAPMSGGELVTRPLTLTRDNLILNFSSSAAGDIRIEVLDENGKTLPGFALGNCPPIFGDSIERYVTWNSESGQIYNLKSLRVRGVKTIRLRFVIKDADLYSIRFM